jgi:hypothetical protein
MGLPLTIAGCPGASCNFTEFGSLVYKMEMISLTSQDYHAQTMITDNN